MAQLVDIVTTPTSPQDSVSTQYVVTDEDNPSVRACCETKPQSFVAMCFPMRGHHVWWPQWIRWWCWTALCGFPPRCSAQPWEAGSCSLRLGLSWRCCLTRRPLPCCSAACCSDLWIVSSSYEVWNRLPRPWIRVSAWQQLKHDVTQNSRTMQ